MEYLHTDTSSMQQFNIHAVAGYYNTLFLKCSTFLASITVAGKLFHILKLDGRKECR